MRYNVDGIGVEFIWDNGDPSVGIRAGWEECSIILPGPAGIETIIGFDVTDGEVADWPLNFVGLLKHGQRLAPLADEWKDKPTVGSLLPQIIAAVSRVWDKIHADEFIENLGQELFFTESYINDLEWQRRDEDSFVVREPNPREAAEIEMWTQELSADKIWYEWARRSYNHEGYGDMEMED